MLLLFASVIFTFPLIISIEELSERYKPSNLKFKSESALISTFKSLAEPEKLIVSLLVYLLSVPL